MSKLFDNRNLEIESRMCVFLRIYMERKSLNAKGNDLPASIRPTLFQ